MGRPTGAHLAGDAMSGDRLVVHLDGQVHRFEHPTHVRIARDRSAHVPVADKLVSRGHLVAEPEGAGWLLRDTGSTRGSFIDGRRVAQVAVPAAPASVTVRLGGPDGPAVEFRREPMRSVPPEPSPSQTPPPGTRGATRHLVVGRAVDCSVHIDDLQASRRHAEVLVRDGSAVLRDLGSANGTFVNGESISERRLAVGDRIGVGTTTLVWDGSELRPPREGREDALVARHLSVATRSGKVLLDDVSVAVPGRGLVAVIGPSGAGKSTLLGALTGLRPAGSGTVTWRGQDLYAQYDDLRRRIGLVPQTDTLHPELTVWRALTFAAKLRLPGDVSKAEREERITAVLRDVDLEPQSGQRIDSLSGGQRKRVSIALELLTAPPLLFLDEPTSGLDPGLDEQVMSTMRELANGDRVVVVVTHSVLNLDICDRVLLLAPGGRTVYYGPPDQLLPYFGVKSYADVFKRLDEPGWHTHFVQSPEHEAYVGHTQHRAPEARPEPAPPRAPHPVRQLGTLVQRHLAVVAADRMLLVLLVAMPLVLGVLSWAVEGDIGLGVGPDGVPSPREGHQLIIILVLGGCLMGSALSVRELVKERSVYARERAVGLSPTAYLLSKAIVVGGLVASAAVLYTSMVLLRQPGPVDPLVLPGEAEVAAIVAAVAVALAMAGLAVSAAVKSADQTMPALVALIMTQLVLCGGLIAVADRPGFEQLSWGAPARFAYAALSSTVGLLITTSGEPDPMVEHTAGRWAGLLALIGVQCVVLLVIAAWLLRRSVARRPL